MDAKKIRNGLVALDLNVYAKEKFASFHNS